MSESKHWLEKWHVAPSGVQSLAFLDGIRGLAILMVVASHVVYVNPTSSAMINFIGGMLAAGAVGVPVFFALSGYLISMPFWRLTLQFIGLTASHAQRLSCLPA